MGSRMKHFDPLTAPLNSPNPLKDTNEGQGGLENEVLDRWEACLLHAAEIEFACQRVHDKGGQKAVREVAHIKCDSPYSNHGQAFSTVASIWYHTATVALSRYPEKPEI